MAKTSAVVNTPATSKINWVNVTSAGLALLATLGIAIPEEYQRLALEIVSMATPVITIVLRTFMTAKR